MTVQFNVAVRNARLNSIEATIGTSPYIRIYSGAPPSACATAASGTLLAEIGLPADWVSGSSGGAITYNTSGTWTDVGLANGTAGYYRFYETTKTTCHEQGTAGTSDADMIMDVLVITIGGSVTISSLSKTDGNP